MRSILMLLALVLASACVAVERAAADDLYIGELATKVLSQPDSDGFVQFSVSCTVKNNTNDPTSVALTVQAIDPQGQDLLSVSLTGELAGGESKTLATESYMLLSEYQTAKWHLTE